MRTLLVYPRFPDTFWSFRYALQFIHKKASSPPLGLLTVAALLPEDWQLRLVDLNTRLLTDEDIAWADMVMISAMVVQRQSTREVITRCKAAGKCVVAGGPLFLGEWQDFPEVDHFVLNEGELTVPLFLEDLQRGVPQRVYSTSDFADMSQSPVPRWDLLETRYYDSLSIQYSRGCPFNCDFCNVTAMLGHRPRTKSADQIVAELDAMYRLGWRRNIFFVDDNFIGNRKQIKEEILPALIEWRKGKKGCHFITEASINLADDPGLMEMMVEAGFTSVFVGIETPAEESLVECHKGQNLRRNLAESVRRLQRFGLQVMGGFIVGFDNDRPGIFQQQLEFIQKTGIVTAMVGMLQAPFGTKLYQRLEEEGRLLLEMSGSNTDGSTNILPKMGLDTLRAGYRQLIGELYSPKAFYERVRTFLENYNPPRLNVAIHWEEVYAFFASMWRLGVLGKERKEYWRLFFWTLWKYPRKFALAITFAIYGYHFRQVFQNQVKT
ncbi:Fe-S oxidoreductase [Bellilinea caldifistulae]|uniref:Methyltransferase n=1 Tax=Bellilinea caldifistulae TaxID=360411 RepID=A0A0P6XK19_9CHLR|nr:B12-binding domain-containing radical SAM protein [Bellilinea caldifistulae]KPL76248.1 methyltransferase [Bellilinea caldifistulae]GAP11906.1 Fe-S oxidoreductase [Bellilinea caldifistulae]